MLIQDFHLENLTLYRSCWMEYIFTAASKWTSKGMKKPDSNIQGCFANSFDNFFISSGGICWKMINIHTLWMKKQQWFPIHKRTPWTWTLMSMDLVSVIWKVWFLSYSTLNFKKSFYFYEYAVFDWYCCISRLMALWFCNLVLGNVFYVTMSKFEIFLVFKEDNFGKKKCPFYLQISMKHEVLCRLT